VQVEAAAAPFSSLTYASAQCVLDMIWGMGHVQEHSGRHGSHHEPPLTPHAFILCVQVTPRPTGPLTPAQLHRVKELLSTQHNAIAADATELITRCCGRIKR
jgi:hypothetical protein